MTYITEALWAEEPDTDAESLTETYALSEEDFQADEEARDRYETYTEEEEDALTLQSGLIFMDAADAFDCSEEDLQSTIEYAQNHMEGYEQ